MFVDVQASSTFCARTFKKETQSFAKMSSLGNAIIQVNFSKTSSLGYIIIQKWNISRYFWIMVLLNDDVFGELCAFFSKYFSPKYFEKKRNVPCKRHLLNDGVIQWRRFSGTLLFFWNIFSWNTFKKMHKVLRKRHLYFWIPVLPNDDIFREPKAFLGKYFSPKYFEKKRNVPQKRHLYFWITVLINDDVFGELRAFFFEIFFSEILRSRSGISQCLFQPNALKNMFPFEVPTVADHVCSCTKLRNAAQRSANFRFHQLRCTLTNINKLRCAARHGWWKPTLKIFYQ